MLQKKNESVVTEVAVEKTKKKRMGKAKIMDDTVR